MYFFKKTKKTYIWHEEEFDPTHGTFQCQPADQKDAEHYVRQDSGDIHSLRGGQIGEFIHQ